MKEFANVLHFQHWHYRNLLPRVAQTIAYFSLISKRLFYFDISFGFCIVYCGTFQIGLYIQPSVSSYTSGWFG